MSSGASASLAEARQRRHGALELGAVAGPGHDAGALARPERGLRPLGQQRHEGLEPGPGHGRDAEIAARDRGRQIDLVHDGHNALIGGD